jgi:hypothetical protein
MKKNLLYLGIVFVVLCTGCHKPKIVCKITEPLPDATFDLGEIIRLSVLAEAENATISEVQLYLDNIGYQSMLFFPYNFQIYTDDLKEGTHTIRAVALASGGIKSEATLSFNIVKYESPDFVSFSDGKIPKGWRNDETWGSAWKIFSPGFDDDYAIGVAGFGELITRKTINANVNRIEFYIKSDSDSQSGCSIWIDNKQQYITLTQSWEKYSFELPQGEHSFKWTINSYSGSHPPVTYLDAIKFFKE